ncbi:MAG: D-2-hydroxyacid dehydrogenase [Nitrososphaerota archaeon]|nr:D-2-hydroxyacid dehydrogenase [Nitrososphaerota archaeon]
MNRVLVCDRIADEAVAMMKEGGLDVRYDPEIGREELLGSVADYDCLVVRSRTKVDAPVIRAGSRLKAVGRAGVGLDNVDLAEAEKRGVRVFNAPDSLTNAVAEHVLGLFISVAKGIAYAHPMVARGEWPKDRLMGRELTGKAFGIVGFGRIGRRLAQLLRPFNPRLLVYDVVIPPADALGPARLVDLDTLLKESDFVSLHVPATPDTVGMMDSARFSLMKEGAVLVNTSRGNVLDEAALVASLKSGRLAGAGLDVFASEPPKNRELLLLDTVVLTPHIAGQTAEAQTAAGTDVARKVVEFFGGPPRGRANV